MREAKGFVRDIYILVERGREGLIRKGKAVSEKEETEEGTELTQIGELTFKLAANQSLIINH